MAPGERSTTIIPKHAAAAIGSLARRSKAFGRCFLVNITFVSALISTPETCCPYVCAVIRRVASRKINVLYSTYICIQRISDRSLLVIFPLLPLPSSRPPIPCDASLHICTHFNKYLLLFPDTSYYHRHPALHFYQPPRSSLSPRLITSTQPLHQPQTSPHICSSTVKAHCNLPCYIPLTFLQSYKPSSQSSSPSCPLPGLLKPIATCSSPSLTRTNSRDWTGVQLQQRW